MILLEDSRQQEGKHQYKHKYFVEHGIMVNRCTLHCGDYQLPNDSSKSVDTKKDLQEIIGDIQFKAMSKKDIKENVHILCVGNEQHEDAIYHLITDDDSERFAEQEITQYCYQHGIAESLIAEFNALYVKRHGFFHRGLVRSKFYGIKVYVLIENTDGVKSIQDVFSWVNPRLKIMINSNIVIGQWNNGRPRYKKVQKFPHAMHGEQLAKAMLTMETKYNVTFAFCKPEDAGAKIIELLGGIQ